MTRISVAMAVYNGERFLPEQLDSILSQLKQEDELIISYDQSSDGSWALLCRYAQTDPRIRLLKNTNPGVIGNFNNALAHCTGDYVFISDQDDKWLPGKRKKMIQALTLANADMAIHNAVHIDETGQIISEPFFSLLDIRETDSALRLILRPRYSGCTMAFSQRILRRCLPMPAKLDCYDQWLAVLCKKYGKCVYVHDILLHHRLHGGNVTPVSTRSMGVILKARVTLIKELIARKKRERMN